MRKKRTCPKCGSTKVAEILYGMPAFTPDFERDLEAGKIVIGGCLVSDNDPRWQCLACFEKWGK